MQILAPLTSEPVPCLQQIEVATFFQLPSFQIIGLPSPEVAEARERVRAAIEAFGEEFPKRRVVLNLSPASIRKRGTGLDLAMALAILAVNLKQSFSLGAWGELGLDGSIKPVGQLTRALFAAWSGGVNYLLISWEEYPRSLQVLENIRKSAEISGLPPVIVPVRTLEEAWKRIQEGAGGLQNINFETHLLEAQAPPSIPSSSSSSTNSSSRDPSKLFLLPLSASLERLVGVAVAGHHHVLLLGPKGTGKSHAIEWLIALKPALSPQERLRQDLIVELEKGPGTLFFEGEESPELVRRVSSQVRPGALVGSATATRIQPGVFSLSHGGLFIADEFPEWHRDSREALREPLERQKVTLTRAQGRIELPARFQLAGTGNLCPCGGWPNQMPFPEGFLGDRKHLRCKCSDTVRRSYLSRLSGPILDRIDLVAFINQAPKIQDPNSGMGVDGDFVRLRLEHLKDQVAQTQERFKSFLGKPPGDLTGAETEALLQKNPRVTAILESGGSVHLDPNAETLSPSGGPMYGSLRSRHKLVRLAYSFAIWDGCGEPEISHFLEASFYRSEQLSVVMGERF